MPDHRGGADTPRLEQRRHAVFDDKQRWLCEPSLTEPRIGRVRKDDLADIAVEMIAQHFGALVHGCLECGLALVQPTCHARVLRPLPREHHHNIDALALFDDGRRQTGRCFLQTCCGVQCITAVYNEAVGMVRTPHLQRVGDICQRLLGEAPKMPCQAGFRDRQCRSRPCRYRQKHGALKGFAFGDRRCFFENQMGVGSPDAKRTDTGTAWPAVLFPVAQHRIDLEWRGAEIDLRVGSIVIDGGRELFVFQNLHSFYQAGDAGCRVEVADVGLERTQQTAVMADAGEGACQRLDLNRVTHARASTVRLDVPNAVCAHPRTTLRLADNRRLTGNARRGVAHLGGTVIIGRRSFDHRMDRIAIGQGVLEPL
ncbi:hypothetical protein D3C71_1023560 [compost metagenome]